MTARITITDAVLVEGLVAGRQEYSRAYQLTHDPQVARLVDAAVESALEAAAPLIAAKALRDFADGMTSGLNKETLNAERRAIKREARARAEALEAGVSDA